MEVRNAYENMVHLKFEPRATSSMLTVLASTNLESKQNGQFGYKLQVPPCLQLLATGKARLWSVHLIILSLSLDEALQTSKLYKE